MSYWLGRLPASGEPSAGDAQWQSLVARARTSTGIIAAQSLQGLAQQDGAMLANVPRVAGAAGRIEGDDGSQAFAESWLATRLDAPSQPLSALPEAVATDADLREAGSCSSWTSVGPACWHWNAPTIATRIPSMRSIP
ncbi:MAG: hypothetical protein R2854_28950 [Caldilineaceae bacterium]